MYKLELGKKLPGGNKKKKKEVKKVKVGGLAIILTGTESHSNLNIAKHCRPSLVWESLSDFETVCGFFWVNHTSTLKFTLIP